jgi:YidC/Oxa1 family membrane protein insertase
VPAAATKLTELLARKENMEVFLGINLLENAGTAFPGVLIPICSAFFMFLSSFLMNRQQKSTDPQTKMMQKTMLIFMPIVIGWSTINFPAGVGLYWTVSSLFQIGQQAVLNKFYKPSLKEKEKEKGKNDGVLLNGKK